MSKISLRAICVSLLFFFSSVGASVLLAPAGASPNSASPAALATAPLSSQEANWVGGNANPFNQNYNPQNVINSSNAQYLGINWLFPLPLHPTSLLNVAAGLGVDTSPLIINGTIYAVTQADQALALNAANGNIIWTDVLPVTPNSTAGKGVGAVSLHLHDGDEQFTTKLFGNTPTWWISADDLKVYAINALTGKIMLNWSIFDGVSTVAGNNPGSVYHGTGTTNVLVDQNKGIAITSGISTNISDTGRCFYRGWNVLVNPPKMIWENYCTPPQAGSSIPADPNWTINQVNSMKGAQIFYPGPAFNQGGPIPGSAVVDLKKISTSQLNATLYDDWGQINQSPVCKTFTGGASTGSTGAGWGAPWLLGTGPTLGLAFVNTNNKDPYAGPCTPGPDLWSASTLAVNETTGQWVWGFQANAHEMWDYDCSWWQAMGNETVNGVNTQVIFKTCKAGYLFELNAQTGSLIWAWTPPFSIENRCQYCYMLNPLNRTQMTYPYFNPNALGAGQGTLCTPCTFSFESEGSYNPSTNDIYVVSQNAPAIWYYVPPNATNYRTNGFTASVPVAGANGQQRGGGSYNSTLEAVNAATGQMVWNHFVPLQGYRGGVTSSGNVVFMTLSSGEMLMLNAKTGDLIRDYFIGGPLNILPSIGATASGQMEVIVPQSTGTGSWGPGIPGNIIALTLQNVPQNIAPNTVTSIATSTTTIGITTTVGGATATVTTTAISTAPGASTGFDATTVYGIAAVAVILAISTGFLALRGRKSGP